MKKIRKKLLVISDDYESYLDSVKRRLSSANYFYSKEDNWLSFDVDIIDCFFKIFNRAGKQLVPIDADIIVIDFGLISYGKWEKSCVKKLSKRCTLLMLTSAVRNYVEDETKNDDFYKNFPVVDFRISDMIGDIYRNCEKAGLKERWTR